MTQLIWVAIGFTLLGSALTLLIQSVLSYGKSLPDEDYELHEK